MDNYLNLIPSELTEIIISYLDELDDVKNIGNLIQSTINWGTISYYNLGKYKNLSYDDYLMILSIIILNKRFNLKYSLDEVLQVIYTIMINFRQLVHIPKEIFNFSKLTSLELQNNQLVRLPIEIGNLTNLQKLYLNNNQLIELPIEMGNLINLQYLDLHHIGTDPHADPLCSVGHCPIN
jgi:hypothetical protein